MMLSVIIVNYRVRYFLELCLLSVQKALQDIDSEVFVVDNHSDDGSLEYLQPRFSNVRFITNTENVGFARANNQALKQATGRYILFLNPDTILPGDFAQRCLAFLASNPGTGGLGVRMIDGSGRFLKESRRGFPSAWVAFCKLSGLTALFPHSKTFAKYYLGHLPTKETHPAPVLSGACFLVPKAVLEKVGSFDERFFMYAEDIDLSWRIEQAGYKNYYLADTTIVHFKGESTLKDIRYVKLFYKAMSQFRRKHFRRGFPALFNFVMEAAIKIRIGLEAISSKQPPKQLPGQVPETAQKTHLYGDPETILEFIGYIPKTRIIVENDQPADELILCEGPSFSFAECIKELEKTAQDKKVKFYAKGSGAAVGSGNRNEQGEVLISAIHHQE